MKAHMSVLYHFVFIFTFLVNAVSQNLAKSFLNIFFGRESSITKIGCLPNENKNRWLLGDVTVGGFTNQLFGIFSMVPTALLLNSSLIFCEVSTRHSFEHSWGEYSQKKHIWLPFHYFFDWNYFQSYWKKKRNLVIVQKHAVASCLKILHSNFTVIPKQQFFGHSDKMIIDLVQSVNISIPISSKYKLLTIGGETKMTAFYSYWQSPRHLQLLHDMFESIRPNSTLQYLIDGIRSQLGNTYVAVHLRIEADKLNYEFLKKHDYDYLENVYNMVEFVASYPIFESYYNKTRTIIPIHIPGKNITQHKMTTLIPHTTQPLPNLYIASGVFHSKFRENVTKTTHFMTSRAYHSLELLQQHGLLNLFTQFNLTGELFHLTQILSAEQLAYVEQEICRRSTHFIHSSQRSSFSYMVLRMRQIDSKKGKPLTMRDYDLKSTYKESHADWGFRV